MRPVVLSHLEFMILRESYDVKSHLDDPLRNVNNHHSTTKTKVLLNKLSYF